MDRIMRRIYNFLKLFIPSFYMIGGFVLIVKGTEIVAELDGIGKYIAAIAILFMALGAVGKHFQEIGMDEITEKDRKKRIKKEKEGKRK